MNPTSLTIFCFPVLALLTAVSQTAFAQTNLALKVDATTATPVGDSLFDRSIPKSGTLDIKSLHHAMEDFAQKVVVSRSLTDMKAAKFHVKPIFRWENPERVCVAGNMFLYTIDGRPHASLGVWCARGSGARFEMQSFSESKFKVELPGKNWSPSESGLKFAELPDAEVPASSAVRRAFQMRSMLSKRFRAELYKYNSTKPENLRLLTKPIYKYKEMPKGVIDGAMYSFAMGTDPEVLVILEARKANQVTSPKWHFAFVPSTGVEVKGYLDEKLAFRRYSGMEDHGSFLKPDP